MTNESQNDPKDDQILAQLYNEGAKDTPPAKLNYEIIKYAANANKSTPAQNQVSSHFGGGWKVPLSMAASVVVVFALLVQLDQSPKQLELPPIPEISNPMEQNSTHSKDNVLKSQPATEEFYESEESLAEDESTFKDDSKESGIDSRNADALIIDKPIRKKSQPSTDSTQTKRISNKKIEQTLEKSREREKYQQAQEISKPSDEFRTQSNEPETKHAAPTSTPSSTTLKSKSDETYAPKLAKPQASGKQAQELDDGALGSSSEVAPSEITQQRSIGEESTLSRENIGTTSDIAIDGDTESKVGNKQEFAPIPVEDWLLMIEKLVARKDYAEAARQLEKFKQAHPNVDVEELDAKIP